MKTETSAQSSYNLLVDQVKAAQVQQVTIRPNRVDYTLKPEFGGRQYYANYFGKTEELTNLLQNHGVEFNRLVGE